MTYQVVEKQKLELAVGTGFVWGVGVSLATFAALQLARRFR